MQHTFTCALEELLGERVKVTINPSSTKRHNVLQLSLDWDVLFFYGCVAVVIFRLSASRVFVICTCYLLLSVLSVFIREFVLDFPIFSLT